jgi:hypothetical protein
VTRHTKAHDDLSSTNANINQYAMLRCRRTDVLLSYHSDLLEWDFFIWTHIWKHFLQKVANGTL